MVTIGTGAGTLNLILQIGSARVLVFKFRSYDSSTGLSTPEDISTKTFSFTVRRFKGDRLKTFNLTNSNGITVPIYSTDEIRVDISAINSKQQEGEYVWELRRTDLNTPTVSGLVTFTYDSPNG